MNINGGSITSSANNALLNEGTLNMTAGTLTCNSTSGNYAGVFNKKNATISGGTITSKDFGVVSNLASASTTISGSVNINAIGSYPILYCIAGTMNVNSNAQLKYTGSASIYAGMNTGTMNINGGTITNTNGAGINIAGGTFHMYGGTITCKSNAYCLYKSDSNASATYHGGTAPRRNF